MVSRKTLSTLLKIQTLAFFLYGLSFFLRPDFTLGTIFGYDTPSFFPRVFGAVFLGVAWLEFSIDRRLDERMDLVWPLVVIPVLLLVSLFWERAAGTYDGSDSFFWVSVAVTGFFAVSVGALRFMLKDG